MVIANRLYLMTVWIVISNLDIKVRLPLNYILKLNTVSNTLHRFDLYIYNMYVLLSDIDRKY